MACLSTELKNCVGHHFYSIKLLRHEYSPCIASASVYVYISISFGWLAGAFVLKFHAFNVYTGRVYRAIVCIHVLVHAQMSCVLICVFISYSGFTIYIYFALLIFMYVGLSIAFPLVLFPVLRVLYLQYERVY